MSHDFESGFFVVKPPWHGLGTVLDDPPETASEAICAAGLNWTVTKECLESVVPVDGTYRGVGLHDTYAIVRRKVENGITRLDALGVVGRQYHPLQNHDAFSFFDRVVQTGMVQKRLGMSAPAVNSRRSGVTSRASALLVNSITWKPGVRVAGSVQGHLVDMNGSSAGENAR